MAIATYPQTISQTIEKNGFACIEAVLDCQQVALLRESLAKIIESNGVKNYGIRRLLELLPAIRELCTQPSIKALVEPILGESAFPIRGLFFDKTPRANWGVYWHQDLAIAIKQRIDTPGFTAWSVKQGVCHVQPPISILERMLTLRLHLDDVDIDNGPLRVIPGSHRQGIWEQKTIDANKHRGVNCLVGCGGAVVMRPLLLHSSRSACKPDRRRVIHIEFAAEKLPDGLEWYESTYSNFPFNQVRRFDPP